MASKKECVAHVNTRLDATGPIGPAGPAGPDGIDGAAGVAGPTGPVGPAGPAGADGATGTTGATGKTGAIGPVGLAGPAGPDGVDGAMGTTGPVGPAGPAGADGAVGPAGSDGTTGAVGPVGPAGPAGADGVDGMIGHLTTNPGQVATLVGTTLNIPKPLPVAAFEQTSKIGLTAAFDAAASSGAQDGDTLAYAWSGSAGTNTNGTVTLGTATTGATTASFSEPGEYKISLTITDLNGNTATVTQVIAVGYYIQVNGVDTDINGQWFGALQDALNWISIHDSANASKYLVDVFGVAADTMRIVPNAAQVHFKQGAYLEVGVDFPVGTFYWSGEGQGHRAIRAATGHGLTGVLTSTIHLDNMAIDTVDAAGTAIRLKAGAITYFNNLLLTGRAGLVQIGGRCFLRNVRVLTSANPILFQNCVLDVASLIAECTNNYNAVEINACTGLVFDIVCKNLGQVNSAKTFRVVADAAGTLIIQNVSALHVAGGSIVAGQPTNAAVWIESSVTQVRMTNIHGVSASGFGLGCDPLMGAIGVNFVISNSYFEGALSVAGTNKNTITYNPWNLAPIFNCVLKNAAQALVTFAPPAASLVGGNLQV